MINYYVDPGQGFVFAQNTSFLWALILGALGSFFFLFKFFFNFLKKFYWIIIIVLAAIVTGEILMHKSANANKVIILGIDAMDPNITERLIGEGKLPNLAYLKSQGAYSRLATTLPAESVVAWTSFATGMNPAGHGVFGFVMRDPKHYLPYLSLNEITNIEGKPKITSRRKARPFWELFTEKNIPCDVYFCPNTFPPERLSGRMLSGMGVPDITGTMGRFSFYTTKPLSEQDRDSRGRVIHVEPADNIVNTEIYGPKISRSGSINEAACPLKIIVAPDKQSAALEFEGRRVILKPGTWSGWQKISFKIGTFKKTQGIFKLYLKSIFPDFELYLSPINFDPQAPPFPISYPEDYSGQVAKDAGLYYTQGMPHDTWALSEDRLNEKPFLEQVDDIFEERKDILDRELKQYKSGLLFFYFDTLDVVSHMFWRYIDPRHPLYEPNSIYQNTIYSYYEKTDALIGDVLKKIDNNTTLIILSDHGFNSFRRSVHLNRWLLENGFLCLKEGRDEGKEFFENIDWSKTKAYALGFGAIYVNLRGRENGGIVGDSEAEEIKRSITLGLKRWQDPQTNEDVVKNVYGNDTFNGPYRTMAPDLFVGFNAGYRVSWQTALGGVPKLLIEDNKKKWSGEHLIDPRLVPAVLFINKKTELNNPSIIDIVPTVLDLFHIDKPKEMPGKSLIKCQTNIN